MYCAAISPPRCPVPRPSSRSSDRKRTCARTCSGLMVAIAAKAAGGRRVALTIELFFRLGAVAARRLAFHAPAPKRIKTRTGNNKAELLRMIDPTPALVEL